jgi:hypothetical protein
MGYILIKYGENEIGYVSSGIDTTLYKTLLSNAINHCISKGWSVDRIIVPSPHFIAQGGFNQYIGAGQNGALLNDNRTQNYVKAHRNAVTALGAVYVNCYDILKADTTLLADGLHLNAAGSEVMGRHYAAAVRGIQYTPFTPVEILPLVMTNEGIKSMKMPDYLLKGDTVIFAQNADITDLNNKLANKSNVGHTHSTSEVIGLVSALNLKMDKSDTLNYDKTVQIDEINRSANGWVTIARCSEKGFLEGIFLTFGHQHIHFTVNYTYGEARITVLSNDYYTVGTPNIDSIRMKGDRLQVKYINTGATHSRFSFKRKNLYSAGWVEQNFIADSGSDAVIASARLNTQSGMSINGDAVVTKTVADATYMKKIGSATYTLNQTITAANGFSVNIPITFLTAGETILSTDRIMIDKDIMPNQSTFDAIRANSTNVSFRVENNQSSSFTYNGTIIITILRY